MLALGMDKYAQDEIEELDKETARRLVDMCDRLLAPLIAAAIVCLGRILLNM